MKILFETSGCIFLRKKVSRGRDFFILYVPNVFQVVRLQVGFPRDGTSRGTSRDKQGRDVPLSLCPGTKKFPCPVVPLSRDKKVLPVPLSFCPGTRAGANVPGQTPLSWDVPGQNELFFSKKETRFPVLELHFSVLGHPFLF